MISLPLQNLPPNYRLKSFWANKFPGRWPFGCHNVPRIYYIIRSFILHQFFEPTVHNSLKNIERFQCRYIGKGRFLEVGAFTKALTVTRKKAVWCKGECFGECTDLERWSVTNIMELVHWLPWYNGALPHFVLPIVNYYHGTEDFSENCKGC